MAGVPLALGEREADPSTWFPLQESGTLTAVMGRRL